MSGAPPDKTDTQRSARLMSAPRISELSLSDGGDSGSFDSKTNTPSPKGDADASDRVRSLEAKVKLLEQQLIEKGGSPVVPRPFLARLHFPSTESDGGSSTVLTPSDLHGSNSPIADDASDIPEEESAVAGSYSPDGGAAGAGVDEDYQDEVPEELEAPALDASLTSREEGTRAVTFGTMGEMPVGGSGPDMNRHASKASVFEGARRPFTADARLLTADELFIMKVTANLEKLVVGRKPLVLLSTGAYNPIHLQHARMFYLARKYLIERTEYQVVGGVLSPSHDNYVKGVCRRFPHHAIPIKHRMAMAELAVADSSWLCVLRWEATRRSVMDYRSVLKHVKQLLDAAFPAGKAPHVMYLCGADHLLMCGPQTIKDFGCICCSRPGFTEELERAIGKKYRRLVHIVDDDALLTSSLDSVSSTKVRKRMSSGQDCSDMVGEPVGRYIAEQRLHEKVSGAVAWSDADRQPLTHDVRGPPE